MKLSTRSRYGLRAMVFIACNEGRVTSSEMIAEHEEVSKRYLDRMLNRLRKAGLLTSVKGQSGGYVLARPAHEIRTDQIIEALEGSLCLVPCVDDPSQCDKSGACRTRKVWSRIASAVEESLHGISLRALAGLEDDGAC